MLVVGTCCPINACSGYFVSMLVVGTWCPILVSMLVMYWCPTLLVGTWCPINACSG